MTDISTGGLRDRLIHDAVFETLLQALTALGWLEVRPGRAPVQLVPGPLELGTDLPANVMSLTREDIPSDIMELGSNLAEDRHVFYVDFYAQNDSVGEHVIGDVRDLLRGKFASIGRDRAVIEVFDRTQSPIPATPAFVCEVQDVVRDRAPREGARPGQQHWFFVRFEVLDER